MNRLSLFAVASLLIACGGDTTGDTGSTPPGTAGQAGAGGGSSGAGQAKGGTGGKATTAGSGGMISAAGTSAAGTAGSKPTAGAGGVMGKAGSPSTGGAAGAGQAGSPGGPSCCKVDFDCGDIVFEPCVDGVCKSSVQGKCWSNQECKGNESCVGASVCPCGALCDEQDTPGVCQPNAVPGDFTICNGPGHCALTNATCCGVCGVPKAGDKTAVNLASLPKLISLLCASGGPVACPACFAGENADLAAFCIPDTGEVDTCGVVEVSKHAVSACKVDADCTMHRAQCCDCGTGAPEDYVALSNAGVGLYEANLCGPGVGGCTADCAGQHPAGYAATCDLTTLHCKITKM